MFIDYMVCVGGCSFVRCMVYALGYKVLFIFGLGAGSNAPLRQTLPEALLLVFYKTTQFGIPICILSNKVHEFATSSIGGGSVDHALRKDPAQFAPDLVYTLTLTYSCNPKPKPQIPNP